MPSNNRPIRVVLQGLEYFSSKFQSMLRTDGWEFRHFPRQLSPELLAMAYHLKRSDLTYAWGGSVRVGKFLALSRLAGVKKLVMFWCGSDTLVARGDYEAG